MNAHKSMAATRTERDPAAAAKMHMRTPAAEVRKEHGHEGDGLTGLDPAMRQAMVATAAYFLAEQRSFATGHELDDWLAAEKTVDASLRSVAGRA